MRAQLYNVARRTLSQETRNRLKQRIAYTRRQLAPIYRARYGTFDARELRDELARRVPDDTEIIMVHCSLNDVQPMYTGTARDLLEALLELAGPDRTLAMPAFCFGGTVGDPVAHYRRAPLFDARRHGSEMGVVSEAFRRLDGVRRSLHPTASICALGPHAEELVRGHHLAASSFGDGTPFGIMARRRTMVLGIGTEYFRSLSQVHAAEDLLGDRYPLRLRPTTIPIQLKGLDGSLHEYRLPVNDRTIRRQTSLLSHLLSPGELVQWRFHGVPLYATSAARVTEALMDAALRGETIYEPIPIRPARRGDR